MVNVNNRKRNRRRVVVAATVEPRRNWANEIAVVVFCFGLALLVWSAILFDLTMIHPLVVWVIVLLPGIPLSLLCRSFFNQVAKRQMNIWLHYVFHLCTTGAVLAFALLASNYYLSSSEISRVRVAILEFGSRNGGKGRVERTPYALIKYGDLEKAYLLTDFEVRYSRNRDEMVIEIQHGFLGFDVIEK